MSTESLQPDTLPTDPELAAKIDDSLEKGNGLPYMVGPAKDAYWERADARAHDQAVRTVARKMAALEKEVTGPSFMDKVLGKNR